MTLNDLYKELDNLIEVSNSFNDMLKQRAYYIMQNANSLEQQEQEVQYIEKTGKWTPVDYGYGPTYHCSSCNNTCKRPTHFCPNCGSKNTYDKNEQLVNLATNEEVEA